MIRMTQFLPNCKFRPPSFPSATLRIWPITALVYQESNAVIIKTTSPGEALYQSHVLRQLLEQIPFILRVTGGDDKLFIGTLEGRMGFQRGKIDNIVGSGMLYQDGVHLTNLLHAKDSQVDFDPGAFPNAIYRNVLPDGTAFCCNIANTQKIVVMGAKRVRAMFDAYEMTCKVVNEFEDPDVPKDPQLRRRYRLNQLSARNELLLMDASHTELFDPDRVERMSRMTRGDGNAEEEELNEHDLVGAVSLHMQTVNMLFDKRRASANVAPPFGTVPLAPTTATPALVPGATSSMRELLVRAARAEQVSNVRHMLDDDSPAMIKAVWEKDPATGATLLDEMIVSQLERHKEIMHLLKGFMAAHPLQIKK